MKFQSAELKIINGDLYESSEVCRVKDGWTFHIHIMEKEGPRNCKYRFHSYLNHTGMLSIKVEIDE